MKAAVLGATGYTGQLLLALLNKHPEIQKILPVTTSQVGLSIGQILPKAGNSFDLKTGGVFVSREEALKEKPDVVFAALPHLKSASFSEPFLEKSVLIDLSADYRIPEGDIFLKAYGERPYREDILNQAAYGLTEWNRPSIKGSDIIAVPGCYPTATLIPLLPLAKGGLIKGQVIVNALSGVSGAGKKLMENLLYVERDENAGPYLPGKKHRHSHEIAFYIGENGSSQDVFFTPHLVPMKKGMTVTTTFSAEGVTPEKISQLWKDQYAGAPFVSIREDIPQSGDVAGSNRCDMAFHIEDNQVFLFSAIDNLMKGASGAAIQNMNVRFGLEETTGLPLTAEV